MQFAQQKTVIAQLQNIFGDAGALAAYMRYTCGGSAEYTHMLTRSELDALAAKGIDEDAVNEVAFGDDEDTRWDEGLQYASAMLGKSVAAVQANELLEQLGTTTDEVFAGVDELDTAGEFTERGAFMQELWDAF